MVGKLNEKTRPKFVFLFCTLGVQEMEVFFYDGTKNTLPQMTGAETSYTVSDTDHI